MADEAAVVETPQDLDSALDSALDAVFPDKGDEQKLEIDLEDDDTAKTDITDASEGQDASKEGEETEEVQPLEAPPIWPAEQKEAFAKLPRDQQEFVLDRHNAMTSDYTRKTQELASLRREHMGIEEVLDEHRQRIDLEGIDVPALLNRTLSFQAAFERDPVGALSWLANSAGLSLSQLAQMEQKQSPVQGDPAIQQLQQEIYALKQAQAQQSQAQEAEIQQAEQVKLENEVALFTAEKDKGGQPRFPHVAEVMADMLPWVEHLAANHPDKPIREILETAYNKAVKANDALSKKLQEQERIARAKAARNAGSSIAQGPGGQAIKTKPRSLDDALELAMSQHK